jgi:protein-disulfide isomerase
MINKKNKPLPSSVTIAFFGVLLVTSLILNLGIFLKLERSNVEPLEVSLNPDVDKQVVDGNMWIKHPDPLFDAYFLSEVPCSTCTDIEQQAAVFEQAFPSANVKIIGLDSDTGQELLAEGVSVVPAIILKKPFEQTQNFSQYVQAGLVNPIGNLYEFRTPGNKLILNESQLPQVPNRDSEIRIVSYVDLFSPETIEFQNTVAQQIRQQMQGTVEIQLRPLVTNLPASLAAEAVSCGVAREQIPPVREEFFAAVNEQIQGKQQLEQADFDFMRTRLGELLALEGEIATCYNEAQNAGEVQAVAEEVQRLGITGAPAFFIGNNFLAGWQPMEAFMLAINDAAIAIQNRSEQGMDNVQVETEAPIETPEMSDGEETETPAN